VPTRAQATPDQAGGGAAPAGAGDKAKGADKAADKGGDKKDKK
jgi:hypothetical protein